MQFIVALAPMNERCFFLRHLFRIKLNFWHINRMQIVALTLLVFASYSFPSLLIEGWDVFIFNTLKIMYNLLL